MTRYRKKVHSAQAKLYQYHKANQKIIGKHSIKELKDLALEYRKQESSSKILFTGKQHENLKSGYSMYRKYHRNDIKIKQMMKDIKICKSVDLLKENEKQIVSIDKDILGKIIGGVSVNATTNTRKVEAAIVTPEKATCAMYTRSQKLKIDVQDGDKYEASSDVIEVESVHSDEDETEGVFDISTDFDDEEVDEDDGEVEEVDCCVNCWRHQITSSKHDVISDDEDWLTFVVEEKERLCKRIKFRTFKWPDVDDRVTLCEPCHGYFTTEDDVKAKSAMNVWPSFMYNLLLDKDIQSVYGMDIWRYFPMNWRRWWIRSIPVVECFEDMTMNHPSSLFRDRSNDLKEFRSEIGTGLLMKIADTCNKHLYPTVLCHWGCSEYIHTCGCLGLDVMIQRS